MRPVKKLPNTEIRQNIGLADHGSPSFQPALLRDFAEI
jgi:hypothetical protein